MKGSDENMIKDFGGKPESFLLEEISLQKENRGFFFDLQL